MGCDLKCRHTAKSSIRFNPRTRMGCDCSTDRPIASPRLFQSTHPHGVRLTDAYVEPLTLDVSIHAPAWGATGWMIYVHNGKRFQSTHPHGVRPAQVVKVRKKKLCFNPRTRMGCDKSDEQMYNLAVEFQSTHPHGVRQRKPPTHNSQHHVSIHAPAWGATLPKRLSAT